MTTDGVRGGRLLLASFAVAAVAASGQTAATRVRSGGGTISPSGGYSATVYVDPAPAFLPPPVTDAPYSGEEVIESSQTLSDGTRLTRTMSQQIVYRDGQGRTRVERPILHSPPMGRPLDAPRIVEITDPVANVSYVLDTQNRVAHRSALRAAPPPGGRAMPALQDRATAPSPPGTESLGAQTIDGVTVEGVRSTQTTPAGAQGYDRDIVVTTDTWTSRELRITMLRKTADPRYGESTFRIRNFSRAEPAMTLFLPPPDYLVREETGSFAITYSKP
ncbi:MAG: hypothetical protein LAQ30_13550 [Acidobacteriia bacterium]|nr:hypothetical protein [Terriglobia bacterium]